MHSPTSAPPRPPTRPVSPAPAPRPLAGGQTLLASTEAAPGQSAAAGRPGRHRRTRRYPARRQDPGHRRHDAPRRRRRQCRCTRRDSRTGRPGRPHRRQAGTGHGHAGRLGRQQRPVGLLSECGAGAGRERHDRPAQRSRPTISSPACFPPRWTRTRSSPRSASRFPSGLPTSKFKQPASRFAMVGVFVAQFDGGVRVAVTGGGNGVFRHAGLEAALTQALHARGGRRGSHRRRRHERRHPWLGDLPRQSGRRAGQARRREGPGLTTGIDAIATALEGAGYFADRRLATAVFLALKLAAPAAARRRAGRRQDRAGQGAGRGLAAPAGAAAVLRRAGAARGVVRMELRRAVAAHACRRTAARWSWQRRRAPAPAGRHRARGLPGALPDPPAAAAGAARRRRPAPCC